MAIDLTSALDEETKKASTFAPVHIEKQFGPSVPTLGARHNVTMRFGG